MDRGLFPDDVVVRQRALQYEADQTVFHILQRWRDGGASGVATGLAVTVSSPATLVDMAVGEGYCPNFEFVQLTAPLVGLALADYTVGVQNFVCLVYTESQTGNEANILDGSTRATRAVRGVIQRTFTMADLLALPPTSANLAIPAQDRVLVCAIVTAQGVGVNLVPANIQLPPSNYRILSMTQPVNVTGVVITAVDPKTLATTDSGGGLATLLFTAGGRTLSYTASGDGGPGAAVPVGAGGTFTLLSVSGVYIKVDVTPEMLPAANTSDANLVTSDVYPAGTTTAPVLAAVQNMSADDRIHRHLIGSGAPTSQNPHGLSLEDIAEGIATLREGIVLGTHLMTDDQKAIVPRVVTRTSSFGGSGLNRRTLLWDIPLINVQHIRFYSTGYGGLEITINAVWNGNSVTGLWLPDDIGQQSSKFEFADNGFLITGIASGHASWDDTVPPSGTGWLTEVIRASSAANALHVFGQTIFGENILGAGSLTLPRLQTDFGQGAAGDIRTQILGSRFVPVAADASPMRAYRSTITGLPQANAFELTFNAAWSTAAGGQWVADVAGTPASKLEIGNVGLIWFINNNPTPTFGDGAWVQIFEFKFSVFTMTTDSLDLTDQLSVTNDITAGGNVVGAAFEFAGVKSVVYSLDPMDAAIALPAGGTTTKYIPADIIGGTSGYVELNSSDAPAMAWGLHLPQGAIVTDAHVRLNQETADLGGGSLHLFMVRQPLFTNGLIDSLRSSTGGFFNFTTIGIASATVDLGLDALVAVRTIDNTLYSYSLVVAMDIGAGGKRVAVQDATVEFTVNVPSL